MREASVIPFAGNNHAGGIAGEVARLRAALERIKAEAPDLAVRALADAALDKGLVAYDKSAQEAKS